MKLSEIKANPNNPRIIRDERFARLKESIEQFPKMMSLRPIVVDASGVVLGGNMRLRALQDLGYKEIPDAWIRRAEELTEEEKRRFIIADNVGFGAWDWEVLANEWEAEDLEAWGLEVPGFDEEQKAEAKEDNYEIPDVIHTDIMLGDLFEIGPHRLLCGDSTDSDQVAKLMNGELADMCFTDPPYDLLDLSYTDNLFLFTNGHIFICNAEQRNVDISAKHKNFMSRWYAIDFRQAHLIANNRPMNRVDFVSEFRTSEEVKFNNLKKGFTTLIECAKIHSDKGDTIHKQEKKIELPFVFIEHHTKESDIILDLFLGSGTTMVAAHQLNRKCYGMELDPKYCQVIVDRMLALDPALEVKRNGEPYIKQRQNSDYAEA